MSKNELDALNSLVEQQMDFVNNPANLTQEQMSIGYINPAAELADVIVRGASQVATGIATPLAEARKVHHQANVIINHDDNDTISEITSNENISEEAKIELVKIVKTGYHSTEIKSINAEKSVKNNITKKELKIECEKEKTKRCIKTAEVFNGLFNTINHGLDTIDHGLDTLNQKNK